MKLGRAAFALGASTVMVVLIATLLPRAYLVNDDIGLAQFLRQGVHTQWMSPVLNRALAGAYQVWPDVPCYALFLYALIIATGAVVIHTCRELVDHRGGFGTVATRLGALMLVASHAIVAIAITWTVVSIAALGTAMAAFVAHLECCRRTGTPASPARAALYGVLLVSGYALRQNGLFAAGAALVPVLGWAGLRFLRRRHLPRPSAVIAFLAPLAIVFAIQNRIPAAPGAEYEAFNDLRGRISGEAAFGYLDTRAPQILERAGWTLEEYRDFCYWLITDDTEFPVDKLQRLVDTGGLPTTMGAAEVYGVLRGIAVDASASVSLFLAMIAGGILLAWLGVVPRSIGWFGLGNLVFLIAVPIAISTMSRFPERVAMPFYGVAALGMFVVLASELASRPPHAEGRRRPAIALCVIAAIMFVWARHLIPWADREPWRYHTEFRAFGERVKARNGLVMAGFGVIEMDPLLHDPQGYDALPGGWGTFTAPWFDYVDRFGIRSGSELLRWMIDNPDAYFVARPLGLEVFVEWMQRRVRDPRIRLELLESAPGMPTALRLDLMRLVTTPLVRGSAEWQLLARNRAAAYEELPGPPEAIDRSYRPIAPIVHHVSRVRRAAAGITVDPADGGLRCTVTSTAPCVAYGRTSELGGIHVAVDGLGAARFELALIDAENIVAIHVDAQTASARSIRWRWDLDPEVQRLGFSGTLEVVPGHPAHQLALVENTADPRDVRALHVLVAVKPGTRAGFELRRLEVAEP